MSSLWLMLSPWIIRTFLPSTIASLSKYRAPFAGIIHPPYTFLKIATIPTYYCISIAIPRYIAMYLSTCNIPNFQFGMLYIRASLHIIFYLHFDFDPRNSTQLKDPRRELGISLFSYLANFENRIIWFYLFYLQLFHL